jgi:hypothetical protein
MGRSGLHATRMGPCTQRPCMPLYHAAWMPRMQGGTIACFIWLYTAATAALCALCAAALYARVHAAHTGRHHRVHARRSSGVRSGKAKQRLVLQQGEASAGLV